MAKKQIKVGSILWVSPFEDEWEKAKVLSILSTQMVVLTKKGGHQRFVFIKDEDLTWKREEPKTGV